MKKSLYVLILMVGIIIFFSLFSGETDEAYDQSIAKIRKEQVDFLKTSSQSPFKQADQRVHPLEFYPINKEYKVRAQLERINSIQRMTIRNSNGTTSTYNKFGYAIFTLKGQQYRLLILKSVDFDVPNTYLTAFADETSGETTYGGGRYLDLKIGKSDNIEIDFNLAYNPYCAYVSNYSCPLPPVENILQIAIEAGEKDYPH